MKIVFIKIFLLAIVLMLGIFIGYNLNNKKSTIIDQFSESRSGGYKFINPLYECLNPETNSPKTYGKIESELNEYIENKEGASDIYAISVYFRDLSNGSWFGVKEKENFSPASLLKLPIAIAYYKKAESNPSILNKKIKFTKDKDSQAIQDFSVKNPLVLNNEYEAEFLISKMLKDSDNDALILLKRELTQNEITNVYNDLDIPYSVKNDDFLDVKEYSAFFRILYNATYLSKNYSEKTLSFMTNSEYKDGLRKSIPITTQISHKFGERQFISSELDAEKSHQLHDCGIVYKPNKPYLICIMTKGKNYELLTKIIQEISAKIYNEVK